MTLNFFIGTEAIGALFAELKLNLHSPDGLIGGEGRIEQPSIHPALDLASRYIGQQVEITATGGEKQSLIVLTGYALNSGPEPTLNDINAKIFLLMDPGMDSGMATMIFKRLGEGGNQFFDRVMDIPVNRIEEE